MYSYTGPACSGYVHAFLGLGNGEFLIQLEGALRPHAIFRKGGHHGVVVVRGIDQETSSKFLLLA